MRASLAWIVAAGLLAGACASSAGDRRADGGQAGSAGATGGGSRPVPLVSAVEVSGTAVLDPAVRVVEVGQIQAMGPDGTTLTLDDGAGDLEVGTMFVVPGVASGRVTRTDPAGDGGAAIHFEQPPVEDLFSELDVSFDGIPDPDAVLWRTDDLTAAGQTSAVEVLELADLEDLPDPEASTGPEDLPGSENPPERQDRPDMEDRPDPGDPQDPGDAEAPDGTQRSEEPGDDGASPAGLRESSVARTPEARLTLAAEGDPPPDGCDEPTDGDETEGREADDGDEGDGTDEVDATHDDDAEGAAAEEEARLDGFLGSPATQTFSFEVEDYTIEVRHRVAATCGHHTFKINATRGGTLSLTASTFGWVNVERIGGGMSLGDDGVASDTYLDISGEAWFSVSGQVKEPGRNDGIKITYDMVKQDMPVVIAGVPFLVRLGVPLTMEARLPSRGDTLTATLLHLTCDGRIATSGHDIPDSTCSMAPVTPHIAESFGPMAFIVAAGFKAGFGPGVKVPLSLTPASRLYAGATATLSASTGLLRSGTAGSPLVDCTRIDRSVQFNLGAEAQVFRVLNLSTSTNVWKKEATDHWGRQCSVSEMSG